MTLLIRYWKKNCRKLKGVIMFRMLDEDSPISKEDLLQFEEILGKKLPKTMLDFYLKHNGGQPQVMGVHDEHHLFPFNSFNSLEEMSKSLTWFDDEEVPAGFKATDLLHFAYDPGSGNYALSLREEDLWYGLLLCSGRKSRDIGQWASFEEFLNSFVEE